MRWIRQELQYWKKELCRNGQLMKSWRREGNAQSRRERQHRCDQDNYHRACLTMMLTMVCQLANLLINQLFDLHPRFARYYMLLGILLIAWSGAALVGMRLLTRRRSRLLGAWQLLFWFGFAGLVIAMGALDLIERDSLFNFIFLQAILASIPILSTRRALALFASCLIAQSIILWDLGQPILNYYYCAMLTLCTAVVSVFRFASYLESVVDSSKLSYLARRDPLTGLFNRRGMEEWVAGHRLEQCPVVCGFLDLDFFKAYNDTFGHAAGDRCLQQIAHIVQGYFSRENQAVCRFGGEELVVLQLAGEHESGLTDFAELKALIESRQIEAANQSVSPYVTVSIGFSYGLVNSAEEINHLIEEADRMLYQAKRDGRNRVASASSGKSYL